MLYTTYFSKIKDIPEDYIKLIITRFPPKWLDISKHPETYVIKQLSPSQELLLKYKEDNNWDEYVVDFYEEMNFREDMVFALSRLRIALKSGRNVCLICYEKDHTKCHRSLIGQYFEEEGIEWREL